MWPQIARKNAKYCKKTPKGNVNSLKKDIKWPKYGAKLLLLCTNYHKKDTESANMAQNNQYVRQTTTK